MAREITFGKEARQKVFAGVEKLAKAVAVTMGPKGKFVILAKSIGAPVITKDGVSVAREITLFDPVEELGCQLVKEAAGRTADVAGDGTTTSTVLTYNIFKGGMELANSGYNPLHFREGIQWALKHTLENLNNLTEPIETFEDLKNIATISANNDEKLGSVIAEAFDMVGPSGMVTAIAFPGIEDYARKINGIELSSGYISPGFLEKDQTKITLENCKILICDREITHLAENPKLWEDICAQNKSLLIVCQDLKKEALHFLLQNHMAGRLKVAAIKIPTFGRKNDEWLEDFSLLVGTDIVGEDRGRPLSEITVADLGNAGHVEISKHATKILNPSSNATRVTEKLKIYSDDLKKLLSESDRRDTADRMSFLTSSAAIINVGYSTESELREKGDRVEDAMSALRAAQEEGYVPGGGFALLKAVSSINLDNAPNHLHQAIKVFIEAAKSPARQIILNGYESPDEIINNVLISETGGKFYGYNSATSCYCDLKEAGIIDPKKVTRTSLENATAVAWLLLNSEATVADDPNHPTGWQPPAGYRLPGNGLNHKY